MLRTNSKKAIENLRNYIVDNFDPSGYTDDAPETFEGVCRFILGTFRVECVKHNLQYKAGRVSEQQLFEEWAAGLPSVLDTCYYYSRSAVDDLGAILEETEAEKRRFSECDAEALLTRLIYREIIKNAKEAAAI